MNKNKKSKFFSLLCVGILGMSLGSCTSTEQTTSSFISSSTTSSSSELNSSSSISEEEQHLEKLNSYIQYALHEGKQINTMHEVIEVLNTNGVTTQQLKTEDKVFLFDLESKNFTVSNKTSLTETEDPNLWIVVSSEDELNTYKENLSVYLDDDFTTTNDEITVTNGIDVGNYTEFSNINYNNESSEGKTVVIRTTQSDLNVVSANDNVVHYGDASKVTVNGENLEYVENGSVLVNIEATSGVIKIENTEQILTLVPVSGDVQIVNNTDVDIFIHAPEDVLNQIEVVDETSNVSLVTMSEEDKTLYQTFDGGVGSEFSPYLISSAEQFRNIPSVNETHRYFKLTTDILFTDTLNYEQDGEMIDASVQSLSNCTIDGDFKSITGTNRIYIYGELINVTLKNMILNIENASATYYAEECTYDTVTVEGTYRIDGGNEGAFTIYAYNSGKYINCVNNADIVSDGTWNNYNAIFTGYPYGSSQNLEFTYENCTNNGSIISGCASMFIANPHYSKLNITITNCKNNGTINSTYPSDSTYTFNPILSVTNDGTYTYTNLTLDDVLYSGKQILTVSPSNFGGSFINGEKDTSVVFKVNEDHSISITPSTNEKVAYYEVYVGVYASMKAGGSHINMLSEKVYNVDNALTTSLKALQFVDDIWLENNPDAVLIENSNWTIYEKDGTQYYYLVRPSKDTLNGIPKQATEFSLVGLDEQGNIVFSSGLTE